MNSRGGRRKLLFGANFPMLGHGQVLEAVNALGLDAEARALFLGGNAERLLSL